MSINGFKSRISQFQQVSTQREKAGSISQKEMKEALTELAPGSDGAVSPTQIKAAQDLFDSSDVRLTRGSKELLKSFIEQYGPGPLPPQPAPRDDIIKGRADDPIGTSAGAKNGHEMRNLLQADRSMFDGVLSAAFGPAARGVYAHSLEHVTKRDDGNFDVEVARHELVGLGNTRTETVVVDPFGKPVPGLADGPDPLPPQPPPFDDVIKVRADDPIDVPPHDDADPVPPQPAPGGPGGLGGGVFKVRADDPIGIPHDDADPVPPQPAPGGPGGPGGGVFKVRADDPIDVPPHDDADPVPPQPAPGGPGGPGGGVFKVRADDPIDVTPHDDADPVPPQPAPGGPGGGVFKVRADDPI